MFVQAVTTENTHWGWSFEGRGHLSLSIYGLAIEMNF